MIPRMEIPNDEAPSDFMVKRSLDPKLTKRGTFRLEAQQLQQQLVVVLVVVVVVVVLVTAVVVVAVVVVMIVILIILNL